MKAAIELWMVWLSSFLCLVRGHRFPSHSFDSRFSYHCTRCARPLAQCSRFDDSPLTPGEVLENEWRDDYMRDRDAEEGV